MTTIGGTTRRLLKEILPPVTVRLARRLVKGRPDDRSRGLQTCAAESAAQVRSNVVPPDPIRRIDNLVELDEALARAEAAFAVSDDEGRKVLGGFIYAHTEPLPPDPYSEAYRDAQMRIYAHVSGRATYDARVNEHSQFDLESAKRRPFPYLTLSADTVGVQLITQGHIIRHLSVPPGSRVVEFGPGWGNLTLQLAQMGYRVTAVEIEPLFGALIRDRASRVGVQIRVVEQDMLAFEPDGRYDAAVFFESLHHCADHVQMLRRLDCMLADAGIILFGAEPIADYPYPWGVRLDGLSAWSMRRFGWLELGFDSSYFLRTLLREGWLPRRSQLTSVQSADVIVARRANGLYEPHLMTMPPDEDCTWSEVQRDGRLAGRRSVMSCTRAPAPAAVEFCVSNSGAVPALITFGAGQPERTIAVAPGVSRLSTTVPTAGWDGRIVIAVSAAASLDDIEARHPEVTVHQIRFA